MRSHKKVWSYCEQTILYILICLLFNPIIKNINNLNSDDVKRDNLINVITVLWIEHETVLVRVKRPNYQRLAVALHLLVVRFWIGVLSRWRTGRAPYLPKFVQGRLFFRYKEMKYRKYVKWMKYEFFNNFSISSENSVMLHNI